MFFLEHLPLRRVSVFKTLHSQLENNDEVRQPEALFDEVVLDEEFAKGEKRCYRFVRP